LSERKAPDLAVKATAILRRRGRDVTLNVVGGVFPGYEWYEADLRELIMENGLEAVVTLSGFSPSVWGAYESADIALAPSRVESLGNSAIEAQLAGRPLVVSRIQGLTEVAADGKFARIVDGDDPQALADAVEGLIEDWPGARQLADSARHNAADRFSPERYYRAIVAIGSG
jgi:glycosyltransferase involved in cell wall biosynthesis